MNVLPGLMHLLANCNFPIRLSNSFLLVLTFRFQAFSSCSISCTLSGVTSIVMVSASKVTPRNSILVVGGMIFSGAVSTPNLSNSFNKWLNAC